MTRCDSTLEQSNSKLVVRPIAIGRDGQNIGVLFAADVQR